MTSPEYIHRYLFTLDRELSQEGFTQVWLEVMAHWVTRGSMVRAYLQESKRLQGNTVTGEPRVGDTWHPCSSLDLLLAVLGRVISPGIVAVCITLGRGLLSLVDFFCFNFLYV